MEGFTPVLSKSTKRKEGCSEFYKRGYSCDVTSTPVSVMKGKTVEAESFDCRQSEDKGKKVVFHHFLSLVLGLLRSNGSASSAFPFITDTGVEVTST
ncbi:hypothetical protein D1007_38986 [Hordeum vulgare]|nr:hypothetical protein D1007_38986 [Hordeum vulgare]